MEKREYKKVVTDFAVCYVYRCEVKSGAYVDTSDTGFFADFYSDAAVFLFAELLRDMRDGVDFDEMLSGEDFVAGPYDSDIYVRF